MLTQFDSRIRLGWVNDTSIILTYVYIIVSKWYSNVIKRIRFRCIVRFYPLNNIKFTRYGIKQCTLTGNKRRHSSAILLQGRQRAKHSHTRSTRIHELLIFGKNRLFPYPCPTFLRSIGASSLADLSSIFSTYFGTHFTNTLFKSSV